MRICKKTMLPCQSESMCSPFQGCTTERTPQIEDYLKGYREGFADARKIYETDVDRKAVEPGYSGKVSGTDWK